MTPEIAKLIWGITLGMLIASTFWVFVILFNAENSEDAATAVEHFIERNSKSTLIQSIPVLTKDARTWLVTIRGSFDIQGKTRFDACEAEVRQHVRGIVVDFIPQGNSTSASISMAHYIEKEYNLDSPLCRFVLTQAFVEEIDSNISS